MSYEMGKFDESFEKIDDLDYEYDMIEQKFNDFIIKAKKIVNLRDCV